MGSFEFWARAAMIPMYHSIVFGLFFLHVFFMSPTTSLILLCMYNPNTPTRRDFCPIYNDNVAKTQDKSFSLVCRNPITGVPTPTASNEPT